jgi:serine/threonine-protein kinase
MLPGASVTLIPVSDLALDSMFAGCRIEGVAARGGMGIVYRATQLPLGRAVALKLVSPDRAADSTFLARFEREARLAASIEHPNVIPVYAAGEEQGRLYIVMRWVEGTDLQTLIAESGALDAVSAARIVEQVGAGLDAAHAAGLVHRDVKPANVLIASDDGHVYLTDFGLTLEVSADTRLTESGAWLGSVNFMAPEQFEAGRVDVRTDVYALGCLLYTALTGEPPFARRTVAATMRAHLDEPPPKPSEVGGVPAAFDGVVARAMAKRPEDRYPSAGRLVEAALAAAGAPERLRGPSPTRTNGSAEAGKIGLWAEPPADAPTSRLQPPSEAATSRLPSPEGEKGAASGERDAPPRAVVGDAAWAAAGRDAPPPAAGREAPPRAAAGRDEPPPRADAGGRDEPPPRADAGGARASRRQAAAPGPTARLRRARRRPASVALVIAAGAVFAAAVVIAVLALLDPFGSDGSTGRVSDSEVRSAVQDFASAYAKEDPAALADALTANVTRVTPGDTQHGRASVVRQYRRQFAANATEDYELDGLKVQPGSAGRATARYTAKIADDDPLTGTVVFGVRRDHGDPKVGLIALTPDS